MLQKTNHLKDGLIHQISAIIEGRKHRAAATANQELTLMYWEIGKSIAKLEDKKSLATLSQELVKQYGKNFEYTKLARMVKFSQVFSDPEIVKILAERISWSHFIELIAIRSEEARLFYAKDAAQRHLGVRELRKQISKKAFERQEIANSQLTDASVVPFNMFKDPYLLDTFGLRENYLESDLEKAILADLEAFILEFGHGFTFVNRQVRMTMDGDDFNLDLLFYHRILKRLVAVELKVGKFKPHYSGQMKFYLKWLDRYERQAGENPPIGLILCTEASRDQIELMELDKEGIAVAEYWTSLPPKDEFEKKINEIFYEAQERLSRREEAFLPSHHPINYFFDKNDDLD